MRKSAIAAGVLATAIALAGCASTDPTPAETPEGLDPANPVAMTIGVIPAIDVAPIYLGVEKGFFTEEGLDVTLELAAGGAAIIPSVLSGDYTIGFSGAGPMISAKSQGLPVKIVAAGNRASMDPANDWSGIVVMADSGIDTLQDLEGKVIASNAVGGVSQVLVSELLDREGVDLDQVEWTEIPIPDMPAALTGNRADAIVMSEPFMSVVLGQGAKILSPAFAAVKPGLTIGTYFTTEQVLAEQPEVVEAFARAMNKSLEYAAANPEEARAVVGTYTEIPEALLANLRLSAWGADVQVADIQLTIDLFEKFGFLPNPVSTSDLIWEGAEQ